MKWRSIISPVHPSIEDSKISPVHLVFLWRGIISVLIGILKVFPSLLVPRVGFSIIWHLQTDKLEGLRRELVTAEATYYQVGPTFPWPTMMESFDTCLEMGHFDTYCPESHNQKSTCSRIIHRPESANVW